MRRYGLVLLVMIGIASVVMMGCPGINVWDPLMDEAKTAIKEAKEAGAEEFAPDPLNKAIDNYEKAKKDYEVKNVKDLEKHVTSSIKYANEAKLKAETIVKMKEEAGNKINDLKGKIEGIKKCARSDYDKALAKLNEAEAAYDANNFEMALNTVNQALTSYNLGRDICESKATTYIVKRGDTLKSIAAKPQIYGDSSKWNVIYKANKAKIKDPTHLIAGQILVIPR